MCGIAGIYRLRDGAAPVQQDSLAAMASVLAHRGPDGRGAFCDDWIGLAHTRLAIIDRQGGAQPLARQHGNLWIVFNGEIFNYLELRSQLLRLGLSFATESDTEVALAAFEAWGEEAFERFDGQFALAIWDRQRRLLTLARDRFGERPLYLCEHRGRLLFASEVKAIFAGEPGVPRRFDPLGLAETFTFWTVVPPRSIFAGIEELQPGHVRRYAGADRSERPYWQLRFAPAAASAFKGSEADAQEALDRALTHATRLRLLRSDVPVGSYLSGGLDSSLVSAIAARQLRRPLHTFSLRFLEAEFDETYYQRQVASALRSEHTEVVVRRSDIAEIFAELVYHAERPMLRTAPAPLMLLSRAVARAGMKVVLTGEGADEMLGGYDLFREAKIRRFWARQPSSQWRPLLLARLYPYLTRSPMLSLEVAKRFFGRDLQRANEPGFGHLLRWQTTASLQRLFSAPLLAELAGTDVVAALLARLPEELRSWEPLAQDQYLEVQTLLSGYLLATQGDRVAMASSVEVRTPFLDNEVVELAAALPARMKLAGLDEKYVLKSCARRYLPATVWRRRKQPYRAPDAMCFVGQGAPRWVRELLSEEALVQAGVFDSRRVACLYEKLQGQAGAVPPSNSDNMAMVGVLSTQLVHQKLIAARPQGALAPFDFVEDVRGRSQ